jgi:hypothetical protein
MIDYAATKHVRCDLAAALDGGQTNCWIAELVQVGRRQEDGITDDSRLKTNALVKELIAIIQNAK